MDEQFTESNLSRLQDAVLFLAGKLPALADTMNQEGPYLQFNRTMYALELVDLLQRRIKLVSHRYPHHQVFSY